MSKVETSIAQADELSALLDADLATISGGGWEDFIRPYLPKPLKPPYLPEIPDYDLPHFWVS